MKARDRKIGLTRAAHNLPRIVEHFELARGRCEDLIALGFAGGSSDTGRIKDGSGPSDPTGSAIDRHDPSLAELHEADTQLQALIAASDALVDFLAKYPKVAEMTADRRKQLGLAEVEWCASCARASEGGHPWRQEAVGTPSEEMAAECGVPRRPLCDWCRRFLYDERCWPTIGLVEHRRKGYAVTIQLVERELGRPAFAHGAAATG